MTTLFCWDINVEKEETHLQNFLNVCNLRNFVKESPFFKNAENLSRIDLLLTNCSRNFHSCMCLKYTFSTTKRSKVAYCDYKNFFNEVFRAEIDIQIISYSN